MFCRFSLSSSASGSLGSFVSILSSIFLASIIDSFSFFLGCGKGISINPHVPAFLCPFDYVYL